ncbi:radical SAM protein [Actinomadura sp. 7K507]|nr:radical SAM protein [Actinomadura sp. 7K507]
MTITDTRRPANIGLTMISLDLTRRCPLQCTHCYNASGPDGTHGSMTRGDWFGVLDQAAAGGVKKGQLIGGEPTAQPDAFEIACHALDLDLDLDVEVYSNLVHIPARWWDLLQRDGISIATSYYSADPAEHNAVTGRPTHRLTRGNIAKAVQLGIRVRVGIVDTGAPETAHKARHDLESIGVTRIKIDRVRPFGRAAHGQAPDPADLCGRCGTDKAAVDPDGQVSPCPMSSWMGVGNVREAPLAAIVSGAAMTDATATIGAAVPAITDCDPDDECRPGYPGSGCSPRT